MVQQNDFIRRMPEASHDLRRRRSLWQVIHIDPVLLALLLCLTVLGLVVLFSASEGNSNLLRRQFIFFIIAYAGMFAIAQIHLGHFARWSILLYLGALILLVLVLFCGVGAKGAQRWLS
ncbi:MAG: rod shape determining protein RodA, partial [Cellvibrionaceae bacterium]